jgi:hypothetical protein
MRFKLAALAAVVAVVFGAASAVHSERAQAFAWSDTCTINIVNRTSSTGDVRPLGLVQVPPNVVAYAKWAALAAIGFPLNTVQGFSTTGIPLTGGCSSILYLNNPGSNVKCTAVAPTVGANAFRCDGNSSYKIQKDNDDIEGIVFVPAGSGTEAPEPVVPREGPAPKVDPGVLKKNQLSGKGWTKTRSLNDLGRFGKLFEESTASSPCGDSSDENEPTPVSGGASLFVRGKGAEAIGELDGRYSSLGKASSTLATATSAQSMKCLAQALTAPGYRATVAANGPDFGQGGIPTSRIVVTKVGGGFKGYVDVVGLLEGKSNTVLVFFNTGKPAQLTHEEDVLEAVADSLQG